MLDASLEAKIDTWLNGNYDSDTKDRIRDLKQNNEDEIIDSFYKSLEFGTGGLRGLMGVGTNRMNKYTVGSATQGLANYLLKSFEGEEVKVAVAHDSRNNSSYFAKVVAEVFAANGIKVYLFDELRPTPELSFAIRYLKCQSGIVITASHNPKEYNGYKAYWNDGGQVVPPHDKNIIAEVNAINSVDEIKFEGGEGLIESIGADIDKAYLETLHSLSLSPEAIKDQEDLKIVYTSIHGTGITLVPAVLEKFGFKNVNIVEEQKEPNGNFPTVVYPNPEEAEALSIALKKAEEIDADILLGTDPDSDRVGIAVKNNHGKFQLLNGNQTGTLLFDYLINVRKEKGINTPNDFIAKTIVTTDLIDAIAEKNGMKCFNTLTGFKYIAEVIKANEGELNFVAGAEESYGYLIGDAVRDKDAIGSVALICELVAYAKYKGKSLFDRLAEIYKEYGFYKESLISITKKGKKGAEEIAEMMKSLRTNPPSEINGSKLVLLLDYQSLTATSFPEKKEDVLDFPKSNVLQFITEDGSKISARPSGTEPKIKFYFSVNTPLENTADYDAVSDKLDEKIRRIIESMNLK
ncbi:phospho-sugar mutase [Chondrinema litorale]|uniref:phospho-sugar mutase n=1 Tax=Chondrinema litorale TaxID=2994555 RepID=UPI002542BE6B|nr:phospho-sugar mutase [Chondrinema litorale]UZR95369.1 phospho-sugar mutase [Chondrinema litorale]